MLLDSGTLEFVDVSPPFGHYEQPEVLVKQINNALLSTEKNSVTRFAYDDKSIRIFPGQNKKQNYFNNAELLRFSFNTISKKISIDFKDKN